jgi:hypothetical protein
VTKRRFTVKLLGEEAKQDICMIVLPFDPKDAFGKVRAPVTVTIRKHMFKSTVARMDGHDFVVVSKKNRAAAGVDAGDRVSVTMELDLVPRTVEPPRDLAKALRARTGALAGWEKLSFTHRREHVEAIEQAKKPETRARRIAAAVQLVETNKISVRNKPARKARSRSA